MRTKLFGERGRGRSGTFLAPERASGPERLRVSRCLRAPTSPIAFGGKRACRFVGAFGTSSDGLDRRFAVTVDLRLIPATKVKPGHRLAISRRRARRGRSVSLRVGDRERRAELSPIEDRDEARAVEPVAEAGDRAAERQRRIKAGQRYYQTARDKTVCAARHGHLGRRRSPRVCPSSRRRVDKWIDVSLRQQTLVSLRRASALCTPPWSRPGVIAGRSQGDALDPSGHLSRQSKHIAAAADSEENSNVSGGTRAGSAGAALGRRCEHDRATEARRGEGREAR